MSDDSNPLSIIPSSDLPALPNIPQDVLDLSSSVRIPLSQISELGTLFVNALQAFGPSQKVVDSNGAAMFRGFLEDGTPVTADMLQHFTDSPWLLGSTRVTGKLSQVRWQEVETLAEGTPSASGFDPVMIFVAVALAEVSNKLDGIAETQEAMFTYMKERDRTELVAAFKTLDEIRANYALNVENDAYLSMRRTNIAQIQQMARSSMELQRSLLQKELGELSALHRSADVQKKTAQMHEALCDYQLALYLEAYSALLDVVLVGNYGHDYLQSVINRLEKASLGYFELYSSCSEVIERDALKSVGSRIASGIGSVSSKLSGLIEATPIGDHTQIDEALAAGGERLDSLARAGAERSVSTLALAKPGFVRPFIDCLGELDRLHNGKTALLTDGADIYVLPLAATA